MGFCLYESATWRRGTHHEMQCFFPTTEGWARNTPFVVGKILCGLTIAIFEYLESGIEAIQNLGIRCAARWTYPLTRVQ